MPEAVIVAATRTPIGRAVKGSLVNERPDDLVAFAIGAALAKVPQLDPASIDDILVGCGMPGGEQGMNMARVVSVLLGLDTVPGATVTRYCASSVQTTRMAFHAIKAGEGDVFVSAGVEAVSRASRGSSDMIPGQEPSLIQNPLFRHAKEHSAAVAAGGEKWHDPREDGRLPDIYIAMGQTAETVAALEGVTRAEQDEYAALSQSRAAAAAAVGFFEREISPLTLADGTVVAVDDSPRPGTTLEGLAALRPVFRPDGTVTAGNACPLNDGAAALVVMSDTRAAELGITPLARVVATAVSALSPEIMGLGPVEASRRALDRAGMSIADIDLVELNEAFAAQVIPSARQIGVEWDRLNVHGGSIALGHPFGMTGARITTTLLNGLEARDATLGLETLCVGGGQGMALIVERLS
ncbi:MAG: acetyl-CoA C-acetyltransferase [Friedmanniella sp.]